MDIKNMDMKSIIQTLTEADGVSGAEDNASNLALSMIEDYCEKAYIDDFNNVVAVVKSPEEGQETALLDAHIDEIGLVVIGIDSKGFLKVAGCGGVDRRLILGQEVTVHGTAKITGLVCTIPPHLTTDDSKVPEISDISIDVGLTQDEAMDVISLGDRITINSDFTSLFSNRVSCKALDDRCCVATILHAIANLDKTKLKYGLTVVFSAQEETGEAGATVATFNVAPDLAIALDVSFALTPDADKYQCGKMGKGTMIGISPILNRKMSMELQQLALKENIPYQFEVMGGKTGTNADVISVTRGGVKTALLSIPLKYMHTPIEVVDIDDCENTSKLLQAFLTEKSTDTEVKSDEKNEELEG